MATNQLHAPMDILNRFYEAEKRHFANPSDSTMDDMLKCFSTDLRIVQSPDLPYGGIWKGYEGFKGWGEEMGKLFDVVDVQEPMVFSNEQSDRVMIYGKLHLKVRETQEVLDNPFCQSVVVDCEAGVIKEIQPFYWNVRRLGEAVSRK